MFWQTRPAKELAHTTLSTPDTFDIHGDRRSNRSLDRFPILVRSEKSQSMGGSQMLLLRLLSPEKTEDREGKV
jgi:hypothetical protein